MGDSLLLCKVYIYYYIGPRTDPCGTQWDSGMGCYTMTAIILTCSGLIQPLFWQCPELMVYLVFAQDGVEDLE